MPDLKPECRAPIGVTEVCLRPALDGYQDCVFHAGVPEASTEIRELIISGDGNWRGFKFPAGLNLTELLGGAGAIIDFPIDLKGAEIGELKAYGITFANSVDISNAQISGKTDFVQVKFEDKCVFNNTVFQSLSLHLVDFKGKFIAQSIHCKGDFRWRGSTEQGAIFNDSKFEAAAHFTGRLKVYAGIGIKGGHKYSTCLHGETGFQFVEFLSPDQAVIQLADFSKAHVVGTDFERVTLIDVNWPIGSDGLRKIWDDQRAFGSDGKNIQGEVRHHIESQYRNLRRAHEMQKDFSAANDFYVGEMDAKRRGDAPFGQRLVLSLYRLSCYYGTGPGRALMAFAFLAFFYGTLSGWVGELNLSALAAPGVQEIPETLWKLFVRTFENLFAGLRQMIPGGAKASSGAITVQTYLDVTFRILGALQFAMLVITFRNMVKRG